MKARGFFLGFPSLCGRSIPFLISLILAISLAAPLADAQSTGGRIRGTVIDPSGGAVVGATVTLINEATHATREAQAGANGEYVFLEVPVGTYEIDAVSQGFKKSARKGIALDLNEVVSVDISLQVGGSTDVVEVTGAPPVTIRRPRFTTILTMITFSILSPNSRRKAPRSATSPAFTPPARNRST